MFRGIGAASEGIGQILGTLVAEASQAVHDIAEERHHQQERRSSSEADPTSQGFDQFIGSVASGLRQSFDNSVQQQYRQQAGAAPTHAAPAAEDTEQRPGVGQMFTDFASAMSTGGGEFQSFMDRLAAGVLGEQPSRPPTSDVVLETLPSVRVAPRDVDNQECAACVICLENFKVGEMATRIPCGHLFHAGCVKEWLGRSNQCPTCRYELPTDNAAYEAERQARVRKPRLSLTELSARNARELQHLASFLGVGTAGCVEKQDIVDRIMHSGKVDVIQGASATSAAANDTCASCIAPKRSLAYFEAMSARQIKMEMGRLGVDPTGCLEKQDMIERLTLAGHVSGPADSSEDIPAT